MDTYRLLRSCELGKRKRKREESRENIPDELHAAKHRLVVVGFCRNEVLDINQKF
jgi:hypothetical protein